jgi:hypothetical protein
VSVSDKHVEYTLHHKLKGFITCEVERERERERKGEGEGEKERERGG